MLLGKVWLWCLIISSALLVFVLEIGVTGFVPAVNDPETVLSVMLICLVIEAAISSIDLHLWICARHSDEAHYRLIG